MAKAVICDDEEDSIDIIRYFIEKGHLPVEVAGTASNGLEAVKLIREVRPDIVFLDINMPLADGFDVIAKESGFKYILITAYGSFEYAQKALRLGALDILSKPIDYRQFEDAVMKAVGYHPTGNEITDTALSYIHTHFAEHIELKDLADSAFCSEIHLSRTFKKVMGVNVVTYIHKVRIGEAVKLLDTREYTIQEVAEKTGYQSLNNFYKYFKEFMGCTPSAYLKR